MGEREGVGIIGRVCCSLQDTRSHNSSGSSAMGYRISVRQMLWGEQRQHGGLGGHEDDSEMLL